MLSGTLTGTCDNNNYKLTCEWSATQNIANNTSTITAKVYLKAPSGWSTDSSYWDCTINGTQVTNDKDVVVSGTEVLLGQRTWTVTHTSSGTCTTTISFSYLNGLTSAGTYTTKKGSGSGTITLNTIPRTSSFTLSKSSIDMGASQTVTISKASSSFTHTIQYTFGGTTTTTHTKTTSTSVSFTPPVSLATKIPNATSGTCTVKVTTYNGSTAIGSTTKTFTLTVPSSVKPTVTLATKIYNGLSGLMLSGKSTIKITPTGTGSRGSTISSYTYSGAGLSGTGASKTTGTLNAGSYTVTVTVKDSRGRTNTASKSFTVYDYSAPTCSIRAYRTDSSGNGNNSGTYVRLRLEWNISNPNNANTNAHTFKIEYKASGATTWSTWGSGTLSPSYSSSNYKWGNNDVGVSTTTSYNFRFTVTDSFGSTSTTSTISTINALLNLEKNGVGIGKIYERGKLDISGDTYSTRFIANGNGKNAIVGTGDSGVYLRNSASGKYLQLKDNGTLAYSDTPIVTGTMSSSGNRWGVHTSIGGDGVMEVGKYLDFHESDGDTSNYSVRLSSINGWLSTNKFDISSNAFESLCVTRNDSTNGASIAFYNKNGCLGYIGMTGSANGGLYRYSADTNSSYRILDSDGTQTITGTLKTGTYENSYQGVTFKRKTDDIGNYLGKIGCSVIGSTEPTVTIEVGKVADTSNDSFADGFRRFSFSPNYFLAHSNNTVNIGSSDYYFKAVYATNGTIQKSDGRYKYILENVDNQTCYELIKDMNLYGYSTLNKRIDEYANTTEISDELQQSSQEDMNLHMGFIAQEIEDSELAKYILIKDELEDEDGNKTGEHIYGIDNYGYTTAIHGALQHEIKLRENLEKEIVDLKQQIKSLKE